MGYCPKCKSEYKEGIFSCVDCNEELVQGELTEPRREKCMDTVTGIKPVLLISNIDIMDGEVLMSLLEEAGIPAYRLEQGTGEYMRLYMGYSVFGADIYVSSEEYGKAVEILKEFQAEPYEMLDEVVNNQKEESDSQNRSLFYSNKVVARIIIAVVVVIIIITLF